MLNRKFKAVAALALGALLFTGCSPAPDPYIETIKAASVGTSLVVSTDKVIESCGATLFLPCAQPIYEVHFNAPPQAGTASVCADFIAMATKLGAIAYSSYGYPAGKIYDQQVVQNFCVAGLDTITTYPDGTKSYLGLAMYDDGAKDGIGKVDTLERREDGTWYAMFSFGRDLGRIGWINYGIETAPTHPTPSASPSGSMQLDEVAATTLAFAKTLIGMKEKDATDAILAKGYTYRVVERDGEHFPVTMDYRPTRINLSINKGIVSDVTVG